MNWFDDCRYIVVDDVPWNKYEDKNFPPKKDFLTANDSTVVSIWSWYHFDTDTFFFTLQATGMRKTKLPISVKVPSIYLMNPGMEGSLFEKKTKQQKQDYIYWKKRAFVIRMRT